MALARRLVHVASANPPDLIVDVGMGAFSQEAGADSVAVIADLFPKPCTKLTVRERMTEWRELSRGTILKS